MGNRFQTPESFQTFIQIKIMKKINILLVTGLGIIIIVGSWLIFSGEINQLIPQGKVEIYPEDIQQEVVLVVDDGEGSPRTFEAKFEAGMTAFDLLKEKTGESNISLKTKSYDIGIMIEEIGDKKNGESGKYWLYYVNGEMPPVAADKKEIKPGDKIEFKFEKSPF